MANDTGGSLDFKDVAAFSYSGANLLQWPHLNNKFWFCHLEIICIKNVQRLNSAGKIILIKFYKQLKFYKYKWKAGIPIPAGLK